MTLRSVAVQAVTVFIFAARHAQALKLNVRKDYMAGLAQLDTSNDAFCRVA